MTTKIYEIHYFDNDDCGRSVTLFGQNKEEVTNIFFEIGDTFQDGNGGGLNYIDEIATLDEDEADIVRQYHSGSELEKRLLVNDYIEILNKYDVEPDEEDLFFTRPEPKRW